MKRLSMIMVCLFAMMAASTGLKAQEISILLRPGWNMIGYPFPEAVNLETAFGDFEPMAGDMIESSFGYSEYTSELGWFGEVTSLRPGWGYLYYSNRTESVTIVFSPSSPPVEPITVTTAEPTDITANSAVSGGSITSNDGNYIYVFQKGICWATHPNPMVMNDSFTENGNGAESFTAEMTDLSPNTVYYVRAFAVTLNGTTYGNELNFVTLDNGGNDHEYVDLGLPSGTLWATCNVGANAPEEYGDYFTWGETSIKDWYSWDTYQHCYGIGSTLTKYCNNASYGYNGFTDSLTTLLPEDDAATFNWGSNWRMPTKEEWQELNNNTTCTWTTKNGVYGRLFTSSNGNSLFLPAAGIRDGSSLHHSDWGHYWSSSLYEGDPNYGGMFFFNSEGCNVSDRGRCFGLSVRAVCSSVQSNTPMGAINGKFTINNNGEQVFFSQGNLQYIGSASIPYWKFAENQWDVLGTTSGQNSKDSRVDRDLFGWGTSGWHDSNDPYNVNYQPWSTSTSTVNLNYNSYGYGPSTNMQSPDLTNSSANYDWGVNNPIGNGGNLPNQWRVLTIDEWGYVFNTRTTNSGIRYAKANVNNVNGIILLPDDWDASFYYLSDTNTNDANYSSNTITTSQWSTLEQYGAVFLPAAGDRSETSVINVSSYGFYWSTSYCYSSSAFMVVFNSSNLNSQSYGSRHIGLSVRLARSVD